MVNNMYSFAVTNEHSFKRILELADDRIPN